MNNKGYVPPLAYFAIVVIIGLIVITMLPEVKATLLEILKTFSN